MSRPICFSDTVVLAMVASSALAMAGPLGLTDPLAAWAVAMGWTCPAARRLLAWRRQSDPQPELSLEELPKMAPLLVGLLALVFLPALKEAQVGDLVSGLSVPEWVRPVGVGLVLYGAIRPLWPRRNAVPRQQTCAVEGIGLLLVAPNPVLATVAVCGLAANALARRPFTASLASPALSRSQAC
jgi:hypothetical protein